MNVYTKEKLEEYILKHREKHYRLAYSYTKNKEDALDIVQDSIYKALSHKGELDDSYIETWFYRIIINTAKDYLKKGKKVVTMQDYQLTEELERHNPYEELKVATDASEQVHEALEKLSTKEREIITLRYFEDMELKEVSEITQQNISTVKSTLYRALKKLQVILT